MGSGALCLFTARGLFCGSVAVSGRKPGPIAGRGFGYPVCAGLLGLAGRVHVMVAVRICDGSGGAGRAGGGR